VKLKITNDKETIELETEKDDFKTLEIIRIALVGKLHNFLVTEELVEACKDLTKE
jgi:hypothetical protein